MKVKFIFSWLLVALICVPVAAQKDKPPRDKPPKIDWDAKAITKELSKLGDPEINLFLPELYKALQQPQGADASTEKPRAAKEHAGTERDMIGLLQNPIVRREIEMIDEQYEEVLTRSREIQSELTRHIGSLVLSSNGSVDRDDIRQKIAEIREAANKQIEQSVLPFQLKRLEQVAVQVQMRKLGVVAVLTSDPVAAELDITQEQKKRLKERAKEIEEQLARDRELVPKARDELFSELKADQRQKLSRMIGEDFNYQEVKSRGKEAGKGAAVTFSSRTEGDSTPPSK